MSYFAQPVQVVMLYENARAFDAAFKDLAVLDARLKSVLRDYGTWQSLKGYNTRNHLGLATDTQHITVQRYDEQMQMNGFADVLANPLATKLQPELALSITQHRRALLIEVGPGSVPGFATALRASKIAEALGDMNDPAMGLSDDQRGYEDRLAMAQYSVIGIMPEASANAIHWVQSQQLFEPRTFSPLAAHGFSLPLYCGPFLFGGEKTADGSVKAGVRALGSQNLLGKMVIFKPHTQDWARSYEQILAFIAYCRSIGRILGDGETFSADMPDAPVIRVTHKRDIPQLPEGYVELSRDDSVTAAKRSGLVDRLLGKFRN